MTLFFSALPVREPDNPLLCAQNCSKLRKSQFVGPLRALASTHDEDFIDRPESEKSLTAQENLDPVPETLIWIKL
jgi:hypothetical protein